VQYEEARLSRRSNPHHVLDIILALSLFIFTHGVVAMPRNEAEFVAEYGPVQYRTHQYIGVKVDGWYFVYLWLHNGQAYSFSMIFTYDNRKGGIQKLTQKYGRPLISRWWTKEKTRIFRHPNTSAVVYTQELKEDGWFVITTHIVEPIPLIEVPKGEKEEYLWAVLRHRRAAAQARPNSR